MKVSQKMLWHLIMQYISEGRTTCLYVLKAGKSKYRQETMFIWSLDYMQEFCLQQEVIF